MRWAVLGALLLGLLVAADLTYLGSTRSRTAWRAASDAWDAWASGVNDAEADRPLTGGERRLLQLRAYDLDVATERSTWEWEGGGFAAALFLACGLIWLTLITAFQSATEPGRLLHGILKRSMIGALVGGIGFLCLALWVRPGGDWQFDRFWWEAYWLVGAVVGVLVGALVGLLVETARRQFRRKLNGGELDAQ